MMRTITIIISLFILNFSQAQYLENIPTEAIENNASIKSLEYELQATRERVNEVNTLPDTEFKFDFSAIRPETKMPMAQMSISAMQMFPWFGTIKAKEDYINAMADSKDLRIDIAKRKLNLSLTNNYYQLYGVKAQQNILNENIELLETFKKLALSSVKIGKASSIDVLRLQIKINELNEELDILSQKIYGYQATINGMLNRDLETPINISREIDLPESELFFDEDKLMNHPELVVLNKEKNAIEKLELVNSKESKPKVGFGIKYINLSSSPLVKSSFKDIIMPMASLSIPIFNNKYKSISQQNELKLKSINAQKLNTEYTLKAQYALAKSKLKESKINYKTLKDNLDIVEDAQEMLLKNYQTNTIDYDEVLEIQNMKLKFQKNIITAIKNYYLQMANIFYLTN